MKVYAFDGPSTSSGQATYTGYNADLNSTQFWSGAENHCDLNDHCEQANITVTKPVTIAVLDEQNAPYADLPVYAFDGVAYTGYHGTTDTNGLVMLTLPQGNYRFRADFRGTQFWSSTENGCAIPGCEAAQVGIPGGYEYGEVTIDYTYDPLYRLTEANYSSGDSYHYAYDAVGNRMIQESLVDGLSLTNTYTYDIANRLVNVDGVDYTWDANGNLLDDGASTYVYDAANRLSSFSNPSTTATYVYNGLGDRLQETVNGQATSFTMDLNAGLTQALSDGTNDYIYGLDRIAQANTDTEYFLGDALGSVRQMTDQTGAITYARTYDPYGMVIVSDGTSQTDYGYTGEYTSQGLVYLRARYYNPADGRFLSRDYSG